MIDSAMESLEIALIGKDDELSQEIVKTLNEERDKMAKKERGAEGRDL
jgi:hypothetical protein